MENTSIATIRTDFRGVLDKWINFTYPFHNLTLKEQSVLAALLYYYFIFKKDIKSEDVVWKMVFDYDTRMKIKQELDMKDYALQNNLTRLRKKKILKNNKIVKHYIPNIKWDAKSFKIVFNFILK